jgi:hypothetical protein
MMKGAFSRFGRGTSGPVLRYRGRKRFIDVPLSKIETIQVLIFLLLAAIVFLFAMYVGWWTLQEEEREFDHQDAAPHGVELIRAEFAGLERNTHNDVLLG